MATTWKPDPFPKGALYGAAGLIAFALVAAFAGRATGIGAVHAERGTAVETRDLRFEDRADGAVLVREAASGRVVDVLAPNTNFFVRGTLRGLVRTRKLEHIGAEPPFRLTRLADGRVSIEDPATQRRIDLGAFGRSNAAAFSAIMDAAGASQ